MQLQKYVTEVIETLGGVVIPLEYALCEVLVPEQYKDYFQGRTELTLSFDFEVAQENPQSQFVTFGSYLLEQIQSIASKKTVSTLRFAEVDRLTPGNALQKMEQWMENVPGKKTITDERPVMGGWAVFYFKVEYLSDEKEVEKKEIWIDLQTGQPSETMKEEQNRIVYVEKSLYPYPFSTAFDMAHAFQTAYNRVEKEIEFNKQQRLRDSQLEKDIRRIQDFYTELIQETIKMSERKGLSEKRKQELLAKSEATALERDKQMAEIKNKYTVRTDIALENGILYFIPLMEYRVNIAFRSESREETVYYNPVCKQFAIRPSKIPVKRTQSP